MQTRTSLGNLVYEAALGAATLTRWSLLLERDGGGGAEQRAMALAFVPPIAFIAGVLFSLLDRGLGGVFGFVARSCITILFIELAVGGMDLLGIADIADAVRHGARPASTGLARIGPVGAVAALIWFTTAVHLLSRVRDPASRSAALVMATMLSRWAIVPIAYGLKPLERWGLGVPYEGGITFVVFAISSAIALGITMGLYENLGLAVIVALALTILGSRLLFSRRLGGVAGYALAGGVAICEIAVLGVLAGLGG